MTLKTTINIVFDYEVESVHKKVTGIIYILYQVNPKLWEWY